MRLTDGTRLVEITMNLWDEDRQQYGADFAGEFFADVERHLYRLDAWLVEDVQYCIDYANDWAEGKGDFMEEADDPEVVNGNRCVDVDELEMPEKAIYSTLSDTELTDLITEHATEYVDGFSKTEMLEVTAEDIRNYWEESEWRYEDTLLSNMNDNELKEFSEAIAKKIHEDADRMEMTKKEKENKYKVYVTGGSNDGALLGLFDSENEAIKFARAYTAEHETEFDPVCGGLMIQDSDGNVIEEW